MTLERSLELRPIAKSPTYALEARDVTAGHTSRAGKSTAVFESVSFTVREGAHLVVLGRSGSGKSTLLRLLNRFEDPLSGAILFRGRPLETYDPLALRRRVALVLQTPVVLEGSVRENLRIRPPGVPGPEDDLLTPLLTGVGLGADFLDRDALRLSVGEKQRVSLARSLISKPDVLLLDEPTSALDPRSRDVVANWIVELEEKLRVAVVVATHQPELVRCLGGPVLLLDAGKGRTDVTEAELSGFLEGE